MLLFLKIYTQFLKKRISKAIKIELPKGKLRRNTHAPNLCFTLRKRICFLMSYKCLQNLPNFIPYHGIFSFLHQILGTLASFQFLRPTQFFLTLRSWTQYSLCNILLGLPPWPLPCYLLGNSLSFGLVHVILSRKPFLAILWWLPCSNICDSYVELQSVINK